MWDMFDCIAKVMGYIGDIYWRCIWDLKRQKTLLEMKGMRILRVWFGFFGNLNSRRME